MPSKFVTFTYWKDQTRIRFRASKILYFMLDDGSTTDSFVPINAEVVGSTYLYVEGAGAFNIVETPDHVEEVLNAHG